MADGRPGGGVSQTDATGEDGIARGAALGRGAARMEANMIRRMLLVGAVAAVVGAGTLTGAVGLVTSARAAAPALDSCPAPSVDIFDLAIPPDPAPAGTTLTSGTPQADQYLEWSDLSTAYGGVSEALINQDPSAGQIEYVDRTIAQASAPGSDGTVPNYTPGFDTAPAGAVSGVDYLVQGAITGSQGAYTVTVSLEDATTRAHIADGSATFADSTDSMAAAQQAAAQLTPVLSKIRAYQRKLKAGSGEMAISPPNDQPLVTPAKSRLKEGQSTSVALSLHDCDGLPLAHRTLKLHATHGRISPASVKTDAQGRAHARFTASSHGIAQIRADYGPYQTVTHKRDLRRGTAAVGIAASGVWELIINAQLDERASLRTSDNTENGTAQGSVHATELIATGDPLNPNAGWNEVGGQATVTYTETRSGRQQIADTQACVTTGSFEGSTASGLPGLTITHTRPVALDLQTSVKGVSRGSFHCAPYDDNPGDHVNNNDSIGFGIVSGPGTTWRGSCSRNGNVRHGYTINCGHLSTSFVDQNLTDGGNATITAQLRVTMTPL
ncbi:MAG: Ig-like domain-containing protein [Solirubrobacteraceae bacterium]